MAMRQSFENWEPPCISVSKEHCFLEDSTVCVNCHLVKGDSLTKRKRHSVSSKTLIRLVTAQQRRCYYCEREMFVVKAPRFDRADARATTEHVVPVSRGGTNDPANIMAACRRCNAEKGGLLVSEWLAALKQGRGSHMTTAERDKIILRLEAIIESR